MLLSSQLWLESLGLDLRIFGDLQQGQEVQLIGPTLLGLPRVQEGAYKFSSCKNTRVCSELKFWNQHLEKSLKLAG